MLDWAAKLLGLQEKFWNSSKQGGGQITVSIVIHLLCPVRDESNQN
jgi:hypothetical protein